MEWATLRSLPTDDAPARTTTSQQSSGISSQDASDQVDITKLEKNEISLIVDRLAAAFNHDPEQFFNRFRHRFDAVGLEFPKVMVQFEHLKVNAFVPPASRASPTVPNFILNTSEVLLRKVGIIENKSTNLCILNDVSGIIRPSRLTLLLGPPSSGKTTLLLALAGRLASSLQSKTSGKIRYNGHEISELIPQKVSAYASQKDWHMAEMTVRETIGFSARCQGVGYKHDLILELLRREKGSQIHMDEDLDILIKAFALGEQKTSLYADFITKILGLDVCADTPVGDEMRKGISGGEKKRLTTGELLVGNSRVLLLDEASTGLDSSFTHQIINYLKHSTRAMDMTTIVSLLQPDAETFELFDDIILLCEGQIVYQGPREDALDFFAHMGFRCPERKNVADFLQEVTSVRGQRQYWAQTNRHHQYVNVPTFVEAFRSFHGGLRVSQELSVPYSGFTYNELTKSTSAYGVNELELVKIGFDWQMLLMKRNVPLSIFKIAQLLFVAFVGVTVFFRGVMGHKTIEDAAVYLGALYFSITVTTLNGFVELPLMILKLPVLYKHKDLHFYPCWVYTLPCWILSIPFSFSLSLIWVGITYYGIGYDSDILRCLKQFLIIFLLQEVFYGFFRMLACLGRNMIVACALGSFGMLTMMALGGFILSRDIIPKWWIWGYWLSPLMYAQNAASVNEFRGHSWDKIAEANSSLSVGELLLNSRSFFPQNYWYWIGVAAMIGFIILFNVLFTFCLTFLDSLEKHHVIVSKEEDSLIGEELKKSDMVLPFKPVSMAFCNVNYYVKVPSELKREGVIMDKLQLLDNVTGAFRPGILTALVGVSGAGKTTLMDVLSGRKTGGTTDGNIYVGGYPKKQETFARVSGYCEQNDIHSPYLTVLESVVFSAWLRLPSEVNRKMMKGFVDEIMQLVELTPLSGALVGLPGVDGLSTEQRKRLTIAVELVANPSIVFMDEPTTGLDARAAMIVMRTVRNIANTGRTIVCTIHQPSIDIFESFDELLLMKRGGKLIYCGPLGKKSGELVKYFQGIEGVPKIKHNDNPAVWVLDISSYIEESRLGVDFAQIYHDSPLFQKTKEIVERLSKPDNDSSELSFLANYSRSFLSQYLTCLWKQNLSYWHNPMYTVVRFVYTVILALTFGTLCWKLGSKRDTQLDIYNAMGSMYAAIWFMGMSNTTIVQPVIAIERFVSYRERATQMYSSLAFAFAQVTVEALHVSIQSVVYCSIFYPLASFEWSLVKVSWYLYFVFFTLLYFTSLGLMTISVTPNQNVAAILSTPFFIFWTTFSGYLIPRMRIPVWWRWCYWVNPFAWSLYGLLTSQYGDMDDSVRLSDGVHTLPLRQLLKDLYDYRMELLILAAIVVAAFCLIFTVIFGYGIKAFNFQKR